MMDIPIDSIICHDVAKPFPLPDEYIDVVITSPPYWGLRDYGAQVTSIFGGDPNCKHIWKDKIPPKGEKSGKHGPKSTIGAKIGQDGARRGSGSNFCQKCGAWYGQLGLEPTPDLYIAHLVQVCCEIKRVLKKTGSFYLNIGDTYYASGGAGGDYNVGGIREGQPRYKQSAKKRSNWLKPKQLLLIPSRVAIALQDDGWILRNDIIWKKPNPMPSSVKDRLNTTFEHVFHFVKQKKYYYDLDEIREPHKTESLERAEYGFNVIPRAWEVGAIPVSGGKKVNIDCHPAGKNPGDVVSTMDLGSLKEYCLNEYEKTEKSRKAYRHKTGEATPQSFKSASEWNKGTRETMNTIINSLEISEKIKSQLRSWWHDKQGHPLGRNPGDVFRNKPVENIKGMRQSPEPNEPNAFHPDGKNPGDVIKWDDDEQYPRSIMKFGRGQTTESLHRDGNGVYHSEGKNPGDIIQTRKIKDKEYKTRDPGRHLNPKGHNPGDVIQFDEEYWWNFILGKAHSNKFYKEAFRIMREWMIKNNCLDYEMFYEWYKNEFKGKWESGNLQEGKANYLSDVKRLPFPRPETRLLGDMPEDFWEICTQPFTGYNPDLEHFAVFPESLVERPLKASCPQGGIVLDPFCGRGTVGKVAKRFGLHYILFDIKSEYCELARLFIGGQKHKLHKDQAKLGIDKS